MGVVKQLKTINYFGNIIAILGVLTSMTYILINILKPLEDIKVSFFSKYIRLLITILILCLCVIRIFKFIFVHIKNKRMMRNSYIYVSAKEMKITDYPKNKAIYTVIGYYSVCGNTYVYKCIIEDGFHLITDYMTSIKEKEKLPDLKVYINTLDYKQYYISPYEYLEKLIS